MFTMTTTRRRVLAAVVVLGIAVPVIYFNVHRGPVRPQPSPAVAGLRPMPAFDLERLDGERFSSSSLSGNVALVDFWATWCRPCLEEIPSWNDLHERYVSKGFTVLGVTVQSGWASDIQGDIEEAKLEINYPLVIGNDTVAQEFGGVLGFPTTFLVDRGGHIYKKYTGQYPEKAAQIEADIQKLLSEQ